MQHHRQKTCALVAACVLLLSTATSCKKGADATTGIPTTTTGSITVGFTVLTAQASTGAPATVGVTLTRSAGYTGAVALTVEGVPTGVTASLNPPALGGADASSILTITVGAGASPGVSTLTVRGTASGAASATASIQLTVGVAGINLSSTSTAVTAVRGGSATVPLTIDRVNSYAGAVTLIADGLPAGVTATFTPALLSGTVVASTLTLSALSTAVVGTTAITVRATGSGVADKTIVVQLTISTP
ncbi:MAG: hypothetical protein M3Y64_06185 [Gemmatimonadota bacterium]|nr:hypothetical protein [Gemmatimonadota bacterium]